MSRLLSDFEIERAAQRVSALLGLHFPETRRRELRQGLLRATEELGVPAEATLEWLSNPELSRQEVDALASHLTVGETYFFRERGVFQALENEILPSLIRARRQTTRTLRIWSAGCCTGEEPYSVAMLLESLIPDLDSWEISLLGTDVNPRFLRRALAGVYKDWSFRDVETRIQRQFFTTLAPGQYELSPDVKGRVRFRQLNLVEDTFPSPLNATWDLDLILCRNVLMYFAAETMIEVVARLRRCLVPGGWLVVSPTETSQRLFAGFRQVHSHDAIVYRREDSEPPRAAGAPSVPELLASLSATSTPRPTGSRPSPPRRAPSEPAPRQKLARAPEPVPELGLAAQARVAADHGELQRALDCCERALSTDKLDPALHHLHATILDELGRPLEAAQALGRALYLDPDFVLAHFALGHLAQKQQEFGKARKHFDNVLVLLRERAPDSELPQSDGLTAGRLVELARGFLLRLG